MIDIVLVKLIARVYEFITHGKTADLEHVVQRQVALAPLDLTESDSIARLANAVSERWDRLDILVINAAVLPSLTPVTQIAARRTAPWATRSRAMVQCRRPSTKALA